MFDLKREIGDHKVLDYDTDRHEFQHYFKTLYGEQNLDQLYLKTTDCHDGDSALHKLFYNDIKERDVFKRLYCNFVKDIHSTFFPNEKVLIYQSFPSLRIQYMNNITIPPHKDSDALSNHPLGEKNFIIPITRMKNTNSIYVESSPDKKDFQSIELTPGELFYFNGNKCTHYNEKNQEGKLRISLDFRIILKEDYLKYINNIETIIENPRDRFWKRPPKRMQIGGYYQSTLKNEPLEQMMKWITVKEDILQHRPTFGKEEADACYKYMMEDNFVTEHKKTLELEKELAKYVGCKHCIMTTSGTCAILLSLMALNLNEGAEVIVPNYTMIATINAVKMLKLSPKIIDVDRDTFTMSPQEVQKHISPKTACVIHVSLNNRHCNLQELVSLCKENNVHLIEDSAQSLGCKIDNKSLGTFGEMGCFSLSSPKIISTGQGGFVVTDDDNLASKVRMIKNFGRRESGKDIFEVFGLNFKFTDLQAIIGLEQLKKMNDRTSRMQEIYQLYYVMLKDHYEIKKPLDDQWFPWFVDIFTSHREDIMKLLKKHSIQTRPTYGELDTTMVLSNSNYVSKNGLFLPSYVTISDELILYICKLLILIK